MVRKRDRYTRSLDKGKRPNTPAPKVGWLIAELANIAQVPLRTLRYYVQLNLLEPSEFRGTSTRYQRREVLGLLGIVRMLAETRLSLVEIKRKLHALSDAELESWIRSRPLPLIAADALGFAPVAPVVALFAAAAPAAVDSSVAFDSSQASPSEVETWQRLRLLPGLDLMLSSRASPAALRAAQSIYDDYVAR